VFYIFFHLNAYVVVSVPSLATVRAEPVGTVGTVGTKPNVVADYVLSAVGTKRDVGTESTMDAKPAMGNVYPDAEHYVVESESAATDSMMEQGKKDLSSETNL
jgi:hypothetical protein